MRECISTTRWRSGAATCSNRRRNTKNGAGGMSGSACPRREKRKRQNKKQPLSGKGQGLFVVEAAMNRPIAELDLLGPILRDAGRRSSGRTAGKAGKINSPSPCPRNASPPGIHGRSRGVKSLFGYTARIRTIGSLRDDVLTVPPGRREAPSGEPPAASCPGGSSPPGRPRRSARRRAGSPGSTRPGSCPDRGRR